ncbi:MAG: CinA family protein, partial [Methylococcales bacterium]|nr:CinA family protein [Methylococcales bacterium]
MVFVDIELKSLIIDLGQQLQAKKRTLAVAESCTGGGISQAITHITGCSQWFDCGFVTYSNRSKINMLGLNSKTLNDFGAVSQNTALEMVGCVLNKSQVNTAIAVTGIAGPEGGRDDKPVGTVFIAWQNQNSPAVVKKYLFNGNRESIR